MRIKPFLHSIFMQQQHHSTSNIRENSGKLAHLSDEPLILYDWFPFFSHLLPFFTQNCLDLISNPFCISTQNVGSNIICRKAENWLIWWMRHLFFPWNVAQKTFDKSTCKISHFSDKLRMLMLDLHFSKMWSLLERRDKSWSFLRMVQGHEKALFFYTSLLIDSVLLVVSNIH